MKSASTTNNKPKHHGKGENTRKCTRMASRSVYMGIYHVKVAQDFRVTSFPVFGPRQELNNGRLAMMGITGLIAQDVLYGDFGEAAVLPCFGAAVCKDLAMS